MALFRPGRRRCALTLILGAFAIPAIAHAQECGGVPAPAGRFAILGHGGIVRHEFGDDVAGRDFGADAAWDPDGPIAVTGGYVFRDLDGTGADPSVLRAAVVYRLPALPWIGALCVKAAAGATRFTDDASATEFTGLAAPVGVVFGTSLPLGASARIVPYISPHVIFATTDSRAFGFDLSASDTGIGFEAGVHTFVGRVVGSASAGWNDLHASLGPTAFPALEIALRLGFVL